MDRAYAFCSMCGCRWTSAPGPRSGSPLPLRAGYARPAELSPDEHAPSDPGSAEGESRTVPEADLRAHTTSAATMWLTEEAGTFSIWRGAVDAPDRLRIETRDGSVKELRLERELGRMRPINLGRSAKV